MQALCEVAKKTMPVLELLLYKLEKRRDINIINYSSDSGDDNN